MSESAVAAPAPHQPNSAAAAAWIAARESNPLDIRIDWHLLALMGISATSFVAILAISHAGYLSSKGLDHTVAK